ncbi:hypothetical protein TKK_0011630 [Trichogramma kaykai]
MIQEPYSREGEVTGFGKYTNQVITGNERDEAPMSCLVILDKRITAIKLTHVSTSHCVCPYLTTPTADYMAVSLYCQFSHEIGPYMTVLTKALSTNRTCPAIIASDVNAISPLWNFGTDETDDRGEMVEGTAASCGLV